MPLSSVYKAVDTSRKVPKDYPRIYLFGDSLTERAFFEGDCGFGWKLREYYTDRVEVVNEESSGRISSQLDLLMWHEFLSSHTTRNLRGQFEKQILKTAQSNGPPAPLFVTIFLGANDACLCGRDTYVPLDEYQEHIRYYVNSILQHPAMKGTKVILISPPPVDVSTPSGANLMDDPSVASILRSSAASGIGHRTWQSKRRFAKKIVEIGMEFQEKTDLVGVLDFWTVITKSACQADGSDFDALDLDETLPGSGMPGAKEFGQKYFTDGLHLGERAYEVLGRELLDLILARWPELKKENFPIREVQD